MMRRLLAFGVVLFLLAYVGAGAAYAQTNLAAPDTSVQGLLDLIKDSASNWDSALRGYASSLFWSLATIQFVITFFPVAIRNGDLSEIMGELIRFILTIGFFAALLKYSNTWAQAIVDSFRQAGASAASLGGTGLSPGDMFGTAVELAWTIADVETWNPFSAVAIALSSVIVLLCFVFIAALMAVTLIESYIVINASVLFMGFGGSQWTREYAVALLRYAVAVGAKLFVLTLLVGIVLSSAKTWAGAYNHDDASMWTMVGLGLVCAYLCKTIPDLIQGLITGVSPGGGSNIGSMAAIAAVAATAGAAALAGGAAGGAAGAAGGSAGGGAGGAAGGGAGGGVGPLGGAGGLAQGIKNSLAAPARSGASSAIPEGISSAARSGGQRTGGGVSAPTPAPMENTNMAAQMPGQTPDDATQGQSDTEQDRGAEAQTDGAGTAPATVSGSAASAGQGASSPNTASQFQAPGAPPQAPVIDGADMGQGAASDAPQSDNGTSLPAVTQSGTTEPGQAPAPASDSPQAAGAADKASGKTGSKKRSIAAAAIRGSGMLSALSVPGMESAAGLSIGPGMPSMPKGLDDDPLQESDFAQSADNIIEPHTPPAQDTAREPPAPPVEQSEGDEK